MNLEESLYLLDKLLLNKRGKELAITERAILQAAWHSKTYLQLADELYLSEGYLKDMAYRLWKQISNVLLFKITKTNFREIMENQDFQSMSKIPIAKNVIDEYGMSDNQYEQTEGIILIVDDVTDNLKFLSKVLRQAGYKTKCTTKSSTALGLVASVIPDLILLDIRMPNIDGYQLCEMFKRHEKLVDVPIIFLSALHDINDKMRAFQVGGVDYVTKPFQPEEIIVRVRSQMKIQARQKQLLAEISQHQETVKVLYHASSFLASLLNHSPDGILGLQCVKNSSDEIITDFSVLLVNPAFLRIFGKTKDDLLVGNKIRFLLEIISPQLFDLLLQVVETGKSINQVLQVNTSQGNQQELCFIIVKLDDGCSMIVRKIF
jgi:CheY-like chemotaxis protein